jgi:hypothetical protein
MILETDPEGYSINICECDTPYIGGRRLGTPDCCERCGMMTPDQFEAIKQAIRADAIAEAVAAILARSYPSARDRDALGGYRLVYADAVRALMPSEVSGDG